jgi:TetR/AcrR family transcriptional regulator, mexJK operon transcriptional repressor
VNARRPGRPAGLQGAALLDVARAVFLTKGFAATTMDEVAARAGISKASLYRAHGSKNALFASVVTDWAGRGRGAMRPVVRGLLSAQDLHEAFVDLATTLQRAVLSPDVVGVRRLVTAESSRFPEVAAAYLTDSWDSNVAELAEVLRDLERADRLRVGDPDAAAHQFTWTAIGPALNACTIAGPAAAISDARQRAFALAAADALVRAGPTAGRDARAVGEPTVPTATPGDRVER